MTSATNARQHPRRVEEDSDEEEGVVEELPTTRTDYPDASQANRRPPFFQSGLQELSIKSDARNFDVCGPYLCTTGYTTRVFDLTSGKLLMEFSHGETIKTISVAFKPGQELRSEGSRIWVGNNIGELYEIDVATQSLVASSASHNRREIIRILRHKKDLWTLDDEGKLFVWPADESGAPNMKYSHQAHRVPRGHTFSMVIRDKLWLALGKEIRIYKPGSESSFTVLESPLVQSGTGDVTSGSYTSQHGGRAYFGHNDGKVTIYSTKDYACLGNVKVSDYKINSLAFVGYYLWAAYRTGKIYVYDTSTNPWIIKKDWRAHDGQVAGLILDPSSIWTLQRLQVTSIGHDQSIRLWDGMLEDDWLENAMHDADVEYCTFHEIKASVVTWNVGASNPMEVRGDFICDAIHAEDPPELLVFGFQEVVDLEDRAVTAKSILGFGKKRDTSKTDQHVSRVYREWRDYLAKCINRYMGIDHPYSELHTSSLIGLFQCIFIRQDVRDRVYGVNAVDIKCGMKGHYGNKVS
jgi:WD40 repeat protein